VLAGRGRHQLLYRRLGPAVSPRGWSAAYNAVHVFGGRLATRFW